MSSPEASPRVLSRPADHGPLAPEAYDLHELLTVDDVAALLKVSPSWVYEHTRSRGTSRTERIPHIRLGKYVRFDPAAIRAFLERKKCQLK